MSTPHFTIRPVENTDSDVETLTRFCHELAIYDGHDGSHVTADKLKTQLFDPVTQVRAWLALRQEEPIGFLLCYECFTVYHGDRGVYVPGAYIIEKYRNKGYGIKLLKHAAQYALENGFSFMNWLVDAKNDNANAIYRKLGAGMSEGWTYVRLSKEKMEDLV